MNNIEEIKRIIKRIEGLYYWRYVAPKKDRISADDYKYNMTNLLKTLKEVRNENTK